MSDTATGTRTIETNYLARVEGEGAMHVTLERGRVADVKLRIYEPPRFFEAFLRGRDFREAPDVTARICGICPVAYQVSSMNAMEAACGVDPGERIHLLRRLLYLGEWLESHALHVFMLHAPDFLGYDSAISMARDHRELVEQALFVKKTGNELMAVVGGREIHPVNVRVGGFYRAPTPAELAPLVPKLERAREIAIAAGRWAATLSFPELEHDVELVALRQEGEYAIERGRIVSLGGLDIPVDEVEEQFVEEHVEWSNALHAHLRDGRNYLVGPLARYALSRQWLAPAARELADELGLPPVVRNPFKSILVRCVELVHAADEALAIADGYAPPVPAAVDVPPRAGVGYGASEAPRGILWHRYRIAEDGTIEEARIVPPTSQNQATIEDDLRLFVERHAGLDDDELRLRCEQAIRNYDPCISCATHFLQLTVDRT